MTVSELIALLKKEDPERIVIMAKDTEGNGYSPLYGMWSGAYLAETAWYGEAGIETLTQTDIDEGYTKEDVIDGVPAIVLVPVN